MARKIQKKKNLILRKKLKVIVLFLIVFNLLSIPLYLLMYFNFSYSPLQKFLTSASRPFIEFFGYDTTVINYHACNVPAIFGNKFKEPVCISWDSTGWKSMYALAALIIATPVIAWKKKLKFLSIGIPVIFLINYLRIVTTILFALKFGWQYFEIVHTLIWREGLILAVVAVWYVWLRNTEKAKKGKI
jgi:exosortase/archaeosortase family protein